MSALTDDVMHPVRVPLSPEQVQARRRQIEKTLGIKLPQDPAAAVVGQQEK